MADENDCICHIFWANNKPEVAMPKNAPFALKGFLASRQNEQSAGLGFRPRLQGLGDNKGAPLDLRHKLSRSSWDLVVFMVRVVRGVREDPRA